MNAACHTRVTVMRHATGHSFHYSWHECGMSAWSPKLAFGASFCQYESWLTYKKSKCVTTDFMSLMRHVTCIHIDVGHDSFLREQKALACVTWLRYTSHVSLMNAACNLPSYWWHDSHVFNEIRVICRIHQCDTSQVFHFMTMTWMRHVTCIHIHDMTHMYSMKYMCYAAVITYIHIHDTTHIYVTKHAWYAVFVNFIHIDDTTSRYRVAKTHRIPYLYRSFSAKWIYI